MNKLYILGSFVLGAAAGAGTAWYILKDKYERLAQEEIEEVREHYYIKMKADKLQEETYSKPDPVESPSDISERAKNKPDITEYAKKLSEMDYTNYSSHYNVVDDEDLEEEEINPILYEYATDGDPIVIPPCEFGTEDTYSCITLTYYSDGYLTDEDKRPVENIEMTVGADFTDHFGEFEDDAVHVRNDRLRVYYEIIADDREYADVVETLPQSMREI